MSDPNISPNMNLPVPVVSTTIGPDWATDVVASLNAIDSHSHATGQGVPITPDGLNINASLPMGGNYLTQTKAIAFTSQSAPLDGSLTGYLYESGSDLYFNDGAGNQVRITQSGSVAGSTGTITGLPSGTASASYSAGTFTFQSATSTPATMNIGPIVTGAASASSKTVTLSASGAMASNYAMTWPTALPGSTSFWNCDTSGNIGFVGTTGSGVVVLTNSPTLGSPILSNATISNPTVSGTPSGTIEGGTYSPTVTATTGSGGTQVSFSYMRIGNRVIVYGTVTSMTFSGGEWQGTITLPIAPTSNFSATTDVAGSVGFGGTSPITAIEINAVNAVSGTKTVRATIATNAGTSGSMSVNFAYSCA